MINVTRNTHSRLPTRTPALVAAVLLSALITAQAAAPEQAIRDGFEQLRVVLTPRRQAVLAAQVAAQVTTTPLDMGDAFAPGDALITLDTRRFAANQRIARANHEHARAELQRLEKLDMQQTVRRQAEAALNAAEANLTATQRLFKNRHASAIDLAAAQRDVTIARTRMEAALSQAAADLAAARRQLAVAEAQLDLVQYELSSCRVEAPYAGRVARLLVQEHEWVERGRPLMEIVDDTVLRARFLIPADAIAHAAKGKRIAIRIEETGQRVEATISHISPTIDAASRTIELFAEIDNAARTLRPGMNGMIQWDELARTK